MFVAVADSPQNDEPVSRSYEPSDTVLTSHVSAEVSAASEAFHGALASSLIYTALPQTVIDNPSVQNTAPGPAPSDGLADRMAGCVIETSDTSVSLVTTQFCRGVVQREVDSRPESANTSLPRSDAILAPRNSSAVDHNLCADSQDSSSPEIDVLPVVKRVKLVTFDHSSSGSSAGLVGKQSVSCAKSSVDSDDEMSTMEPSTSQPPVHRCGSPGLNEDGEFSRHRPRSVPASVTHSQSNAVRGVKLIPLSQVKPTGILSVTAAGVKKSHEDKISTETADIVSSDNENPTRSAPTSQQTESVPLAKAGRSGSKRLQAPKSVLGRVRQNPDDQTKAVKFSVPFGNGEMTDKENICLSITAVQQPVSSKQPSQQESAETSRMPAKSRSSSGNCSLSGEEPDTDSAKVRRSFIKCARLDVESTHRQRLPTAWEKHTVKSPTPTRRMSDRIKKQEENDVAATQPSERKKSSPKKRSASSSSSGLSSCERKSARKCTRTIAMTSLHTE